MEQKGGGTPPGPLPAPTDRSPATPGEGSGDPVELLQAGSPRDVLRRLVEGDPLALEPRTRRHLSDHALLLDAERLYLRASARAAFAASRWNGSSELDAWLAAQVERAAADLVREDRAAERFGRAPDPAEARYVFLAEALGVEPALARRACVVFNDLPERVRRVWWAAVVEQSSLARCVSQGLGSAAGVRADLRRALLALSLLEDPGPDPKERGDERES